MSNTQKLIAVVGATGQQGGAVVRALQRGLHQAAVALRSRCASATSPQALPLPQVPL